MSKILITGGAGFIGSHLVEKLNLELGKDRAVWIMDDFSGGSKDNIPQATPWFEVDCRDAKAVEKCFEDVGGFDIVYHLAANAAENKAQFSPIDITSRNYSAFINVLTSFIKHKGKRFIFTSSIAVYGEGKTPFKEKSKPEPEDLYGISKLAAEQTLKVMSKVHDFEYVIARPHNVYGPKQNMRDPYRNVVTIFMNNKMKRKKSYIYGDGKQKRCFSYIDDVVDALYKCGFDDVSGMTFNIGSDKVYTVNKLAKEIGGKYSHLPERPQEVKEAISDHTLSKKYLGYKDKTSLKEGIKRTWEYCKSIGPQEALYSELEIVNDKVPSNWL